MAEIRKVTIIGAGIMGGGIANAAFKKGFEVTLFDLNSDMLAQAVAAIKAGARRNMNPDLVRAATSFADAVGDADLVVEAIIENLEIKQKLFKELDTLAPEHTIFASNTSSLPISKMAEVTQRGDRFIGMHFFSPVVVMRLVELIRTPETSDATCSAVEIFVSAIRKTGVACKESPGFIVNRILIPLINEGFYVLQEQHQKKGTALVTAASDIDAAMVASEKLLVGPFTLVDMVGLDTAYRVSEIIYKGFNDSPRYVPCTLLKDYFDKEYYGLKSKRGVYCYENNDLDPAKNPPRDPDGVVLPAVSAPTYAAMELIAPIVNEGFRILEEGLVTNWKDVDTCMELGARWPHGPFHLAKIVGVDKVIATLKERSEANGGNARYEACALLENIPEDLQAFLNE